MSAQWQESDSESFPTRAAVGRGRGRGQGRGGGQGQKRGQGAAAQSGQVDPRSSDTCTQGRGRGRGRGRAAIVQTPSRTLPGRAAAQRWHVDPLNAEILGLDGEVLVRQGNAADAEAEGSEGDEEILDGDEQYAPGEEVQPPQLRQQKSQKTQDIAGVFEDSDDGKMKICMVCKEAGATKVLFVKDVSTLRNHIISRMHRETHFPVYKEYCITRGIAMHSRVDPDNRATSSKANVMPEWTVAGFCDRLVEFIVSEDQAFRLIESESFRQILRFQRPQMPAGTIPGRTQLGELIREKAETVMADMKKTLKNTPGLISLTWDGWTSGANDPYLAVTAHWIQGTPDDPKAWRLHSRTIGFDEVKGNHSGSNSAKILMGIIDRYGIRGKLGWATGDNVRVNDTTLEHVQKYVEYNSTRVWIARERRARCMAHSIHLSAKYFALAIQPAPKKRKHGQQQPGTAAKRTRVAGGVRFAADQGDDADDAADDGDNNGDDDGPTDPADDDGWGSTPVATQSVQLVGGVPDTPAEHVEFEAGNLLSKVLAMVTQIRASPQAQAFLCKKCLQEGEEMLALLQWIRTRWSSLFGLLQRVLKLRKGITAFLSLADDSPEVPKLRRRKYTDFKLTPDEWELLEVYRDALAVPANAQDRFSSVTEATMWRAYPILIFLINKWTEMSGLERFEPVKAALESGVANLRKWYFSLEETPLYFISLVLHPRYKHVFLQKQLRKNGQAAVYQEGMAALENIFLSYYNDAQVLGTTPPPVQPLPESPTKASEFDSYMDDIMQSDSEDEDQGEASSDPLSELRTYLAEKRVKQEDLDIVQWWGSNTERFPILSKIARDYLAIQGSSVTSERAFSSAGLTDDKRRNSLSSQTMGYLQILKSNYSSDDV